MALPYRVTHRCLASHLGSLRLFLIGALAILVGFWMVGTGIGLSVGVGTGGGIWVAGTWIGGLCPLGSDIGLTVTTLGSLAVTLGSGVGMGVGVGVIVGAGGGNGGGRAVALRSICAIWI